jgi:hypothetical protein
VSLTAVCGCALERRRHAHLNVRGCALERRRHAHLNVEDGDGMRTAATARHGIHHVRVIDSRVTRRTRRGTCTRAALCGGAVIGSGGRVLAVLPCREAVTRANRRRRLPEWMPQKRAPSAGSSKQRTTLPSPKPGCKSSADSIRRGRSAGGVHAVARAPQAALSTRQRNAPLGFPAPSCTAAGRQR